MEEGEWQSTLSLIPGHQAMHIWHPFSPKGEARADCSSLTNATSNKPEFNKIN